MYASGLYDTQEKTPTAVIDTSFTKSGLTGTLLMKVQSVSDPIDSSDLKLSTSWSTTNAAGEIIRGGAVIDGAASEVKANAKYSTYNYSTPIAMGPGVSGTTMSAGDFGKNQWFGNYTLLAGTIMSVNAAHDSTNGYNTLFKGEPMTVVLGEGWENLKSGDTIDLTLVYTPTGGIVYSKKVVLM